VDEIVLPAPAAGEGDLFSPEDGDAYVAVNRILRAGGAVARLLPTGERTAAAGAFVVKDEIGRTTLREMGLARHRGNVVRVEPVRAARIGVFEPWGSSMETGWTEWVLEQYEFGYERVFGDAIEAGDLGARFDVLVFATGLPATSAAGDAQSRPRAGQAAPAATTRAVAEKVLAAMPPFESWTGQIERVVRITRDKGVPNLRAFVEGGGTLVVFAGQTQRAAKHFDLPVEVGLYRGEGEQRRALSTRDFFIPGSLVAVGVDAGSALATGVPARIAAMFRRSDVLTVAPDAGERCRVVATFGERGELMAGWALGIEHLDGKAAVVECPVGLGRVILYGPDVIYRGQPHASFKLFFNALYGR
jgi:hypothetical protein